jgi:CheY-like chemotaxis protein
METQHPPRILVVDDEATIRFTLRTLLERQGYAVMTATSGLDALERIERYRFDLLLLDLIMPGMGGLEVAQQAQTLQPVAAILIFTGSDLPEDVDLTSYDCISKTASPEDVVDRVAELVQHQRVIGSVIC